MIKLSSRNCEDQYAAAQHSCPIAFVVDEETRQGENPILTTLAHGMDISTFVEKSLIFWKVERTFVVPFDRSFSSLAESHLPKNALTSQ